MLMIILYIRGEIVIDQDQQQDEPVLPSLVVLIGFRATGKTAVGRSLAGLLGFRFMDTDEEIVSRLGCSITESVGNHGWQPFRDFEREVLVELAGEVRTVVATGGGSVLHQRAWQQLRTRAFVVWLRADAGTIVSRLLADEKTTMQRPSLSGQGLETEIPALLEEREPLYRDSSDMVLETVGRTPDELAALVCQQRAWDTIAQETDKPKNSQ